jgi:SET domain-containing protein
VIDKVYVKQSEIHGKGVFAKRNIKPDEFVTFYPGDTVECYWNGLMNDPIKVSYWGEYTTDTHTYAMAVDNNYVIIGNPNIDEDVSYVGHLINDASKHDSTERSLSATCEITGTPVIDDENANALFEIENYDNNNRLKTNCDFYIFKNELHVGIRATKNIKAGEELLIHYGSGYWQTYNEKKNHCNLINH